MAKKKNPDDLARRIMVSIRSDHVRIAEYIALSQGGFSGWLQDQLDKVHVEPMELLELRDKKYPGFKDEAIAKLTRLLGADTVLKVADKSDTFDFETDSGLLIRVDVENGHPKIITHQNVAAIGKTISLKQVAKPAK